MAKATHLICRREGARLKGLTKVPEAKDLYRSCCWAFGGADASALVGGWIYLHPKKSDPSEFGGRVLSVEPTALEGVAREDRCAVIFEARAEGRGQAWRGADHGMAWTGGLVDLTLKHEKDA